MGWIRKSTDTGWRNITSLLPVEIVSGRLLIRRTGPMVWLDFDSLLTAAAPTASWHSWGSGVIPTGFRYHRNYAFSALAPQCATNSANQVTSTIHALGPVRIATNGSVIVYGAKTFAGGVLPIQGLVSWPTSDPFPTTSPGVSI